MNPLLRSILLLIIASCWSYAQLRIEEFQASNTSTHADMVDFEDYADWVELYNPSTADLDLGGYYLTDNLDDPLKWGFPAGTLIPADGYLVVWTDGRDAGIGETHRREYWPFAEFTTGSLHTSFKLDAAGEELGLFLIRDGGLVAIDTLSYPRQTSDLSRGRLPDAPEEWAYFGDPTPGARNTTLPGAATQRAGKVAFAPTAAFADGPQTVRLQTPSPAAEIYYSTDGSKPSKYAPASTLYTGPIQITENTVFKARTYEAGRLPGPIETRTYFIGEPENALPILSYSTDPRTFWDLEKGIYRNNLKQREVPVHVEMFESDRTPAFSIDAGSRIGGLNIWRFAQKPLILFFRSRYGADALVYPLFGDGAAGTFAQINLRNGGDDWPRTMLRDPLAESIVEGQMRNQTSAYRPVSLFLNGEYWGIHNIRERFDSQFFLSHFNLAESRYLHLEYVAVPKDGREPSWLGKDGFQLTAANGDLDDYEELISRLDSMDMSLESSFEFARSEIDIDSFIDFLAVEIYGINTSWFHNRELWKPLTEGGRWQWFIADLDRGLDPEKLGTSLLEDFEEDQIYAALIRNERFRERFIQRYTAHLNNTFNPERLGGIVDSLQQAVAPEMSRHTARWSFQGGIVSTSAWNRSVASLKSFIDRRAERSLDELGDYFHLGERSTLTVSKNIDQAGSIYVNGVRTCSEETAGIYFRGIPVELTAVPAPGYSFLGWETDSAADTLVIELEGDTTIRALFRKESDSRIPAEITSDVTLTREDSPYYATGDVRVGASGRLRVEAGVEIRMPENGSIYVEGRLDVAGTEEAPVRIVPNADAGAEKWGALCFVASADSSLVDHLYLRRATRGADPLHQIAALSSYDSDIVLDHLDIAEVDYPIFVRYGSVVLRNSRLSAAATCDYINVKNGRALVENGLFLGNDSPDTDAIDYDGVVDGVIRNNTFYSFTGANSDAIDIGEQARNILIEENRIFAMSDKGISVGQRSTVDIRDNFILECNLGVAVKDSSFARIDGNTFYGNSIAVACYEKNLGQWGGTAEVTHSILASSSIQAVMADDFSAMTIDHSAANTEPLPGEGNLFLDIGFTNPSAYDLTLRADSPCIDAGDPGREPDRDGSVADIGAGHPFASTPLPAAAIRAFTPPVLISEIMYRAGETADSGDWVEFHNSTDEVISLSGWTFTDSDSTHRFLFPPGVRIKPHGYLVLVRDLETFRAVHPEVASAIGNFDFGLGPEDQARLYDAGNRPISQVAYRNRFPWPEQADGQGASLALNHAPLFNSHVDNWHAARDGGSPGRANSTATTIAASPSAREGEFELYGNAPNPFNQQTAIRFFTASPGPVEIAIYAVTGQRIAAQTRNIRMPGPHEFIWNGTDRAGRPVASGIYFYTVTSSAHKKTARMLLLR